MYDPRADADQRYARGELTREQWIQTKADLASRAPPPVSQVPRPPPRVSAGPGARLFLIVVVVVAIAIVAAFLWVTTQSGADWNPTYAQPIQMQFSGLAALNASATRGHAYIGNNTLWFESGSVSMVVYGSPADHDMAFVIQGMVNPTLHVARGAHVTVTMVNMDSGEYHTWSLTNQGPPYSTSSGMMGFGGMMTGTMMGTSSLAPMSGLTMWTQRMGFMAQPGTFWYVCAVSSHAASGMYGQLIVG